MRSLTMASLALALTSGCYCSHLPDRFTFEDDAGLRDAGDASQADAHVPIDGGVDAGIDAEVPSDACTTTCGGSCVDTSRDPLHCGSCERSCAAPENGTATCMGGACGFACHAGYELIVGMCVARNAPRPIAPISTAAATSRRPTFRWELAPGNDGARLEICADRACTLVLQTIDAVGTSAAPPTELPSGVVFWRLFGRMGSDVGVAPSSTWQLYIGARTAPIDTSWGSTPDLNGDGFADIVVGAPAVSAFTGRIYIYRGGVSGVAATATTTIDGPAGAGSNFGFSVASAGDVNGDGFADLVVGAYGADSGSIFVYHGGPSGVEITDPTIVEYPDLDDGSFGWSVSGAGDVDGDGYADVVVGAPTASSNRGRAYLYRGGPSGLSRVAAADLRGPDTSGRSGASVAGGDVNGDGFADIIVGADGVAAGRVHVYLGSASGVSTTPVTRAGPDGSVTAFGHSVANAGDVNGDGRADVVVGANAWSSDTGRAYIYMGATDGLATTPTTLTGPDGTGGYFGHAVASAGDVNGDGYSDVVVGAEGVSFYEFVGAAFVFHGGASGPAESASTILRGTSGGGAFFGEAVAGVGDLDGNGFSDLVVTAPRADSFRGRLFVYGGSGSGLLPTPDTRIGPEPDNARFGQSVAGCR